MKKLSILNSLLVIVFMMATACNEPGYDFTSSTEQGQDPGSFTAPQPAPQPNPQPSPAPTPVPSPINIDVVSITKSVLETKASRVDIRPNVDKRQIRSMYWQIKSNNSTRLLREHRGFSLIFPQIRLSHAGNYELIGDINGVEKTLAVVKLVVTPRLRIIEHNLSNQSVELGKVIKLTVRARGPQDTKFQWLFSKDNVNFRPVSSNSQLTTGFRFSEDDQGYYKVIATSNAGGFNQKDEAGSGLLRVSNISATLSGPTYVYRGSSIHLKLKINTGNYTIHWYKNGLPLPGTSNSLTIPVATFSDTGRYSVGIRRAGQSSTEFVSDINVKVLNP